jgi:lipopolysaccharide biosynthesis glycosyltransferase
MFSFLNNTNEKLIIHVIHKTESTSENFPIKIKKHEKLEELLVYRFNSEHTLFPNIENSHVSEATYYRIFFDGYIENISDIDSLIYIDCDMVCISNPFGNIRENSKKLLLSEFTIGAKTEDLSPDEEEIIFSNLNLLSGKYLNAGFLIIDVKKWLSRKTTSELTSTINNLKDKITYWDQDVFNSYFDGQYLELPKSLNTNTELESTKLVDNNSLVLHYYGKTKPWNTKGILNSKSRYYQENFRSLNLGTYHITHKKRGLSAKQLFNGFLTFKIFSIYKPLIFLREFVYSLFR